KITGFDLGKAKQNRGDAVGISPLTLTVALTPSPVHLPDNTPATGTAASTVSGTTNPGARVELDTNGDGQFNDGNTVADGAGHFSLPVTLTAGNNTIRVRAIDSFDQVQTDQIQVTLDTTAPSTQFTSPAQGFVTNRNVTVS